MNRCTRIFRGANGEKTSLPSARLKAIPAAHCAMEYIRITKRIDQIKKPAGELASTQGSGLCISYYPGNDKGKGMFAQITYVLMSMKTMISNPDDALREVSLLAKPVAMDIGCPIYLPLLNVRTIFNVASFCSGVSNTHSSNRAFNSGVSSTISAPSAKNCESVILKPSHIDSSVGIEGMVFLRNIFAIVDSERPLSFARRYSDHPFSFNIRCKRSKISIDPPPFP